MLTRKIAIENAHNFITEIKSSGLNIKKAYLFGSIAKNTQNANLDIDLALVADEFSGAGFFDTKLFAPIKIKKEYLAIETKTFNTKEWNENDNPFIEEIIKTGIEIK